MAVEFYDVKKREKVKIDDRNVVKTKFTTRDGHTRYGLSAKTADGRLLTKFINRKDWEEAELPRSG